MKNTLPLLLLALTLTACGEKTAGAPQGTPSATPQGAPSSLPMPDGPATSALRILCDGDAAGAEVTINGQFKGECPLDMQVPAGTFKLLVRKPVDAERERRFEQEIRLGDGVVKKVEVALSGSLPTAEALKKLKAQGIEPGKSLRDCADCPEMVMLPPGEFMMGSPESEAERGSDEGPQHKVSITYSFAAGKYEVTFAEWDACVTAGGCKHRPKDEGWGRGKRPVIDVSWNDAQEYTKWLTQKTGKAYRLLSESEWEYAARAMTTTPFYTGSCISTDQANYDGTSDYNHCGAKTGVYRKQTVEVGSFKPNAFGLHDMSGNVWEWVQDCRHDSYSGAPDDGKPQLSGECSSRVLRGGSSHNRPDYLRAAFRLNITPDSRLNNLGFRVAR